MATGAHLVKIAITALVFGASCAPAFADVKDGVDAWSRGEYDAAVEQWRDPALKGDADAQFNMGQAYKLGRGVKTDLAVALDWYRKAAAQNHLQAADSYGHLLHYQGRIPEALPYLQSSADRGDPRGQYLLATELFNGVHIKKDWVRAYALMTRASSAGMTPASRSLAQMDQYVPIEQRQAAMVLASELEQRASRARTQQLDGGPTDPALAKGNKPVVAPSSKSAPSKAGEPERTVSPAKPVVQKSAVSMTAADGPWRIQLGAFGEEENARKLWNSLEGRMTELAAMQPYLKASGNLTRLQAGPFATKAAADAMCAKMKAAGQTCIAVTR